MHKKNTEQLLDFFHLCERLKIERRHGKTSDNGEDKVASHSWRLAVIVMFLAPFLEKKINLLKALKIALIHDLPEVITGDQAYFKHSFDKKEKIKKARRELSAIKKIISNLPKRTAANYSSYGMNMKTKLVMKRK
jgi:putative hydrolases of HD superfamily